MTITTRRFALLVLLVLPALLVALLPSPAPAAPVAQPSLPPGLFGLNMYITGRERTDAEAEQLIELAQQAGVRWTREEISWASWGEKQLDPFYDRRIKMIADAGIGIIGMLLTTHNDYRDPACEQQAEASGHPEYWCPPTDPAAFAAWARLVVERYDGDGTGDAPGSPRIAAWEIWNEPDQDGTWLPQADPTAYATLLRLAYAAIKEADPSALVLSGGVMHFDSIGVDGFMDNVVAAGAWDSFDVLSLHPWLIDHAPDAPTLINPRERFDVTIPGRLAYAQNWVASRGGGKPIWITEVGWSTCGDRCEAHFAKSEEQQATYMVRTFVLAAANGVQHVSYFQLEDKFSGEQIPWSQAAILNDDLSPKLAYHALKTAVDQLQFARYSSTGPLHTPGTLAHHRFSLSDGGTVDVLWSLGAPQVRDVPLNAERQAMRIERDGAATPLPAGSSSATLTIGEAPVYVRQVTGPFRLFPETSHTLRGRFLSYWENHGSLEILGMPISAEHTAPGADGGTYTVQWLERARLEHHPENAPPHDVLLGLLGVDTLAQRGVDWRALPTVESAPTGCRYFPETRHSLCPPFLGYWERRGGLPVFGYPISEPRTEVSADDGQSYTVQYFERNRFEHHPENVPPYDVLLGRLGAELMP